jgi:hypothetical protein
MKNLMLTTMITCSLGLSTASIMARDSEQTPVTHMGMNWPWSHGLKEEVTHLNRMRGHVRWQLRNYRGNRDIRANFFKVSRDIDEINARFKSAAPDQRRLRHDVESAHVQLHRIETALHVKPRDFYPWQ